jgi:hypothetical protein
MKLAVNQTVVDAEGAEHYRRLSAYLRPLGIGHQMVMAYDVSATYSTTSEIEVAPNEIGAFTTFGDFSETELETLLAAVETDCESLPFFERVAKRYYLRGLRARLLKPSDQTLPNPPCVALHSHLRLYPNGDIPTCQFNSQTVGNLRKTPFATVWQSDKAERQRQWVQRCKGCWAECEVLPNAIYSGDLLVQSVRARVSQALPMFGTMAKATAAGDTITRPKT